MGLQERGELGRSLRCPLERVLWWLFVRGSAELVTLGTCGSEKEYKRIATATNEEIAATASAMAAINDDDTTPTCTCGKLDLPFPF
jgi:hypothetical protein